MVVLNREMFVDGAAALRSAEAVLTVKSQRAVVVINSEK
jgi:hypothetical protein